MHRHYAAAVLISLAAVHTATAQQSRARVVVSSGPSLRLGDDVDVRLDGLIANTEYQLVVSSVNEWGLAFRSSNVFLASASGTVDLARDAPVRGSYVGADRLGVFWSALRQGTAPSPGPLDTPADTIGVSFVLRQSGRTVDSTHIVQCLLCRGSTVREIREGGVIAALYEPAATARAPLIALLGGSGGGMSWQRQQAASLAANGYSALAVAYFGAPGLPPAINEIPLEYFRTAVDIAARSPRVDTARIALMGLSRGAEGALILAAQYPRFSAVIAFSPSHVSFMGQRPPTFQPVATWTLGGKPLPFVPTIEVRAFRATDNEAERHVRYLALHADSAARAAIPVERIRGPVLLFAGGLDPIWPSAFMAEMITERLEAKHFPEKVQRVTYDSAGHVFARPGYVSTAPSGFTGGDPRANAYAQVDSWRRTLAFLEAWRAMR